MFFLPFSHLQTAQIVNFLSSHSARRYVITTESWAGGLLSLRGLPNVRGHCRSAIESVGSFYWGIATLAYGTALRLLISFEETVITDRATAKMCFLYEEDIGTQL